MLFAAIIFILGNIKTEGDVFIDKEESSNQEALGGTKMDKRRKIANDIETDFKEILKDPKIRARAKNFSRQAGHISPEEINRPFNI